MNNEIYPLMKAFERHYNKTRKVARKLEKSGLFHFNAKYDVQNGFSSETKIPDQDLTIRFAILMRRFLKDTDRLFYKKLWDFIQIEFESELSQTIVEKINKEIERLKKNNISIKINDEDINAESVYELIAEGEYFSTEKKARDFLSLDSNPMVSPVFWFQFYNYTIESFAVISFIFSLLCDLKKGEGYKEKYGDFQLEQSSCIYCLSKTGDFKSEEHIFPEGLGNEKLILPRGYVCDTCNHKKLSGLDEALLNFGPIAFLRVQFVPITKSGKLPVANFQNIFMKRTSPRQIHIEPKDRTGNPIIQEDLGDGWFSYQSNIRGKTFDPKLIARALFKIALGMVAFGDGNQKACEKRYDPARAFILHKQNFSNNFLMLTKGKPQPSVQIGHLPSMEGTFF
ncbi:hypothetical protein MNBD_CHLOROFLEXI01-2625, partial [hydrothermal vent metagenome]